METVARTGETRAIIGIYADKFKPVPAAVRPVHAVVTRANFNAIRLTDNLFYRGLFLA
jgi:hypothetical protein